MRSRKMSSSTAGWLCALVAAAAVSVTAQEVRRVNVSKLGPQVGQPVPDFTLPDQHGKSRTLQSVMGPKGAMIVFFRSADW
jgi:cytochrome oxidase Cu insertion factor (SCO1/SenC/PrrC family)